MKKKLSTEEYVCVASMLFGLFFGAGNLIFPVHMGQMAGSHVWTFIFSIISFLFANLGLNSIIAYSVPMLMFLYPLAIVLIALALLGRLYDNDTRVYRWAIGFTLAAALYDVVAALPERLFHAIHGEATQVFGLRFLPLAGMGLGWVRPAAVGLVIGLAIRFAKPQTTK